MAFDNPDRNDVWKEIIEEMVAEVAKLREAIAPLLEEHQLRERQRAEMQAAMRNTQMYEATMSVCDCSPSRTAALAQQLGDWIDRQMVAKKN